MLGGELVLGAVVRPPGCLPPQCYSLLLRHMSSPFSFCRIYTLVQQTLLIQCSPLLSILVYLLHRSALSIGSVWEVLLGTAFSLAFIALPCLVTVFTQLACLPCPCRASTHPPPASP
jgi:hypothetical protein